MKAFKIVLFDGICNLCQSSVQRIIQHDHQNQFKFASLQSDYGQKFLEEHHMDTERFSSIILLDGKNIYTESNAILRIAKSLDRKYRWLSFLLIVPKFIRDGVYRWVSKNRYKWFGKQNECWLPTAELQKKFIQ